MGNSLKAFSKKEEYYCCYCVQPTCIAPQGSQRETLSRFPGISLLFVLTAYSRKKRSSRSVVDAIDHQLCLLGYFTEIMWVAFV